MRKTPLSRIPEIDFDLRQLEIFKKVVELGSFSKAGEAVFLAQASVSERLATLENMVGVRLLDRLGRRVVPTRAGEVLYKHAVELLGAKRAAVLEMQNFLGMKQGEIHMGGSTIPGEYILPKVIGRFVQEYPLISISLGVADSEEIERGVLDGDFELGIIGRKSGNRNLASDELWKDELILAVPAKHPWSLEKEVSIQELAEEPFISREPGSGTLRTLEDHLNAAGLKGIDSLRVVARLGTSTAVKEGVKAGVGVSIISTIALETELKAGILKVLKVKNLRMTRSFYLIRDNRRSVSPLCKTFIDFLVSSSKQSKDPVSEI
jgi:DNA-binding transcriptional LysR family regulator